ncbi:MAG: hypothetical protein H7Y11_11500, partial [Armatimonadetes bacterium]|nr:hypothetical protein [Anaerolineae bacterium]
MSRDKRPVGDLSIEELERVLVMRKREDRQRRLTRMQAQGRVVTNPAPTPIVTALPVLTPTPDAPEALPADLTLDALDALLARNTSPAVAPVAAPSIPTITAPASVAFEADDAESEPLEDSALPAPRPRFFNRVLLLVEVAAVLGLMFLGANLYVAVGAVQEESAEAQAFAEQQRRAGIPTPLPTSVI